MRPREPLCGIIVGWKCGVQQRLLPANPQTRGARDLPGLGGVRSGSSPEQFSGWRPRALLVFLALNFQFASFSPSSWQSVCVDSLFLDPLGNFCFPGNSPVASRFSDSLGRLGVVGRPLRSPPANCPPFILLRARPAPPGPWAQTLGVEHGAPTQEKPYHSRACG